MLSRHYDNTKTTVIQSNFHNWNDHLSQTKIKLSRVGVTLKNQLLFLLRNTKTFDHILPFLRNGSTKKF